MTKQELDNWYQPRTAEESATVNANLRKIMGQPVLTTEDEEEIKWDHLMGDADDARESAMTNYVDFGAFDEQFADNNDY